MSDFETSLFQELSAASSVEDGRLPPRDQASAILFKYKHLIDALPEDEREKLLAAAQDIIAEKTDDQFNRNGCPCVGRPLNFPTHEESKS